MTDDMACTEETCISLHGKALSMYLDNISEMIKVEIYKKYCGVNGCCVNSSDNMIPPMDVPPTEVIEAVDNFDAAIDKFIKNHLMVDCKTNMKTLNLLKFKEQPDIERNREAMLELEKNSDILIHETQCHEGKLTLMKKLLDDDFYELISTLAECISYTPTLKIIDLIMILRADDTNRFIQLEIDQKSDPVTFGYYHCRFSLL